MRDWGVRCVAVVLAGWVETGGVFLMPTGVYRRVGDGCDGGDGGLVVAVVFRDGYPRWRAASGDGTDGRGKAA
ncbi:hypothetical protein B0T18DRAFT_401893 [Schizothecium vesticola]|uniref:Uncharacterized protein n=1 Tax=Schizothecium vesticola TaxID=314040 RepID=A0AA40K9T1_9PEZI|nr:hypothetical protein B0T18DRAFT_401893 [Schizothecium vesticola]